MESVWPEDIHVGVLDSRQQFTLKFIYGFSINIQERRYQSYLSLRFRATLIALS